MAGHVAAGPQAAVHPVHAAANNGGRKIGKEQDKLVTSVAEECVRVLPAGAPQGLNHSEQVEVAQLMALSVVDR